MVKKILILANEFYPFKGGVSTYVTELLDHIDYKTNVVTLVAPDYGQKDKIKNRFKNVSEFFLYHGSTFKKTDVLKLYITLFKIKGEYDVVHICDWPFWLVINTFKWRFKYKKIQAIAYGSDLLFFAKHPLIIKYTNVFKLDRIVAISNYTKSILLKTQSKKLANTAVDVVYLGVNDFWLNDVMLDCVYEKQTKYNIISVSRLDTRKGLHKVLDVLNVLPKDIASNLTYHIVGKGDEQYKEKLNNKSIDDGLNVVLHGSLTNTEIKSLYQMMDLFILPGEKNKSKVEGFGLVFVEAGASGLPSLVYDVGASGEVVSMLGGRVCTYNDSKEMSNEMQVMLGQKSSNMNEMITKFDWNSVVSKTFIS